MNAVVSLAVPGDDAGIRGLVRREALPGRIRVAFPSEPDFSLGCAVTGLRSRLRGGNALRRGRGLGKSRRRNPGEVEGDANRRRSSRRESGGHSTCLVFGQRIVPLVRRYFIVLRPGGAIVFP